MDISFFFLSGAAAGLALAVPLGAIGVLLVHEGVSRGLRRGIPGAAAVATVDILYCAAAVGAGALAGPVVSGWTPWPQIVGGSALIAIGVRGLVGVRRTPAAVGGMVTQPGGSLRRYALFLGLTAINPATLLYFTAILTALGQVSQAPATAIAFIAGVGIASFGWQALLVALGAGLRHRMRPSFQRATAALGNGLVVALGVALVLQISVG
ncbi:LysE family transporter [Herbiconiux sp.]|uniref:LysE family transporter n=1 Tax=Herbiconiux sp. TaxID=1871186 RepID=UPI0025BFEFA7|nr:LysE family transporter [Herbiconiux sp.]